MTDSKLKITFMGDPKLTCELLSRLHSQCDGCALHSNIVVGNEYYYNLDYSEHNICARVSEYYPEVIVLILISKNKN